MSWWERWWLDISSTAVIVTGIVYAWMKYVGETEDPFSVVGHSWQPLMLNWHILVSPFLVLILGITFSSHILSKIRSNFPANRRSGWSMVICFLPMVLSGYLLQVLTNPIALQIALVIHLITGGIFAVCYVIHQVINFRIQRLQPKFCEVVEQLSSDLEIPKAN